MALKKVTIKTLNKLLEDLKDGSEDSIGIYLYKGLRVQISKYGATGSERYARLYHRRRVQGLCVVCGNKVTKKNPRTGKPYRLCEKHRKLIDRSVS